MAGSRDRYSAAERAAWQAARIASESARLYGGRTWNGTQWVNANGAPVQRAAKAPNPFGRQGSLSKTLDKQLQKKSTALSRTTHRSTQHSEPILIRPVFRKSLGERL